MNWQQAMDAAEKFTHDHRIRVCVRGVHHEDGWRYYCSLVWGRR